MKKIWLFVILFGAVSTSTFAQVKPITSDYNSVELARFASEAQFKNPNSAMWISIGATFTSYIVGPLLMSAGSFAAVSAGFFVIIVAPSTGYIYIDNKREFWRNSGARFLGVSLAAIGTTILFVSAFESIGSSESSGGVDEVLGSVLVLGGVGLFVYSTFRDFIHVRRKTKEYNNSLVQSVNIQPVIDPINSTVGLGFRLNF